MIHYIVTYGVVAIISYTLTSFLIGCTANVQYRTNPATTIPPNPPDAEVTPGADPTAMIESCADYTLGYVEFDDQGWFWNTKQRDFVEAMVRREAGLPETMLNGPTSTTAPTKLSKGIILVTFVHGWKENATYTGDAAIAFRAILLQLNQFEQQQVNTPGGHPARKVVGVFAGWRGLSAAWEPFKELSIFERKETAHKVGGYGAMTKLFTDLENIQKDSLDSLEPDAPRTELIIIGHSLGAGAVYSALAQIVTERFANSIGRGRVLVDGKVQVKRLKPLGDQIILLNPAFEASRHFDLYQMEQAILEFPPDQRPVLSIFTSKGDLATKDIFPIYRFVASMFGCFRSPEGDINQRDADWDTVGWYKPFITHNLEFSEKVTYSTTQPGNYVPPATDSIQNVKKQKAKYLPNSGVAQKYYFDHTILDPVKYRPGSPFIVAAVDKQIMDGHNDYSNTVIVNFLREYIEFCRVSSKDRMK